MKSVRFKWFRFGGNIFNVDCFEFIGFLLVDELVSDVFVLNEQLSVCSKSPFDSELELSLLLSDFKFT
jgi:hypothetical protein